MERVRGIFDGNGSIFAAAIKAVPIIDGLTADECRKLATDPTFLGIPGDVKTDYHLQRMCFDAIVEHWFRIDSTAGDQILALDSGHPFPAILAKQQPRFVLERITPNNKVYQDLYRDAFAALGRRNASDALQFLDQITDSVQRKMAELAIASGLAESDPVAAIALSQKFGVNVFDDAMRAAARLGPEVVRHVLATQPAAHEGDSAEQAALISQLSDLERITTKSMVPGLPRLADCEEYMAARRIPPAQRLNTLEALDQHDVNSREEVAHCLLRAWVVEDPLAAMSWLSKRCQSQVSAPEDLERLKWTFGTLYCDDPGKARSWLDQLAEPKLRASVLNNIAYTFATEDRVEEAKSLLQFDPGDLEYVDAGTEIVEKMAIEDPEAAAAWFANHLSADKAIPLGLIYNWYQKDPTAVSTWVLSQDRGQVRDEALMYCAAYVNSSNPEDEVKLISEIDDPKNKSLATRRAFYGISLRKPEAEAWIRSISGLEPGLAEKLIRLK